MSPTKPPGLRNLSVLLVEDNPVDVRFTTKAIRAANPASEVALAEDGEEAMAYLRRQGKHREAKKPDLILLDLNLPLKDGREVLAEVKKDPELKRIPVVIFSTSQADPDVLTCYNLNANCYATKPFDLNEYNRVVREIHDFWAGTARLPPT